MSKKEKIKSLKKTVKELKAQVRKLKLATASKRKIGKSETAKPQMPTPPSAVRTVAKPEAPKPVVAAPRVAG